MTPAADLLARYQRGPAARRERAAYRWQAVHALLTRWRAAGVMPDTSSKRLWARVRDELRALDWRLVTTRKVKPGDTEADHFDHEISTAALARGFRQWCATRELQSAAEILPFCPRTAAGPGHEPPAA
jgi:hypothetical protein